jgi:hypothetical protein
MKQISLLLFILSVSVFGVAQTATQLFFKDLYYTDVITYQLERTEGYVLNRYQEDCIESITFTKGSSFRLVKGCKDLKPKNIEYRIEKVNGEVCFHLLDAIWDEPHTLYQVYIDKVAISTLNAKTREVGNLKQRRMLTFGILKGSRLFQRHYYNFDEDTGERYDKHLEKGGYKMPFKIE